MENYENELNDLMDILTGTKEQTDEQYEKELNCLVRQMKCFINAFEAKRILEQKIDVLAAKMNADEDECDECDECDRT